LKPLFFYDRRDQAQDMIVGSGCDDGRGHRGGQRVLAEHRSRTGVIRLRPFMPDPPIDSSAGGDSRRNLP
jgi:hypothetical protein